MRRAAELRSDRLGDPLRLTVPPINISTKMGCPHIGKSKRHEVIVQ
jgi:hypothetical protein